MKENTITQEAQVIMLPTDKASKIHKVFKGEFEKINGKLFQTQETRLLLVDKATEFGYPPQHLYFINDELIEKGDITMNMYSDTHSIFKVTKIFTDGYEGQKLNEPHCFYGLGKTLKKIIATTNPDLWCKGLKKYGSSCTKNNNCTFLNCDIPKIPIEFVEAYVKEQGKIDKVLVEYEEYCKDISCGKNTCYLTNTCENLSIKLKLKSNGSVIVHPFKEKMYTKEEVTIVLNKALDYNRYTEKGAALKKTWIDIKNKWLEQNL